MPMACHCGFRSCNIKKNQNDELQLLSWCYKLHKQKKTMIINVALVIMVSKRATQKKD
jgi:hypothetical protein